MTRRTIPRSGAAPLAFNGDAVASDTTRAHDGPTQNRWHDATIYRTAAGKYVVAVSYHTCWQGELEHDYADVADSPDQVPRLLAGYDPLGPVTGYPAHPAYDAKRARMAKDLTLAYQAMVGRLLASDPAFSQHVD